MLDGDGFEVRSYVETKAFCKECGEEMWKPFSLFSQQVHFVCLKCELLYELKIVKVAKNRIDEEELKKTIKDKRERMANDYNKTGSY